MDGPAVPIPPPLERDEIRLTHSSTSGPNLMAATNIPSELERSWRGALLASTNSEACAGSKQGMEPQITQTDHVAKAADATAWPPPRPVRTAAKFFQHGGSAEDTVITE